MTTPTSPVTLTPLLRFPEVCKGNDLAEMLLISLRDNGIQLRDGDILVISSKVVSKAMGLTAPADEQAEVVLSQSVRVVAERMTPAGVTRIVESVAGPVMTAAGVDASNTADESILLLLPHAPDSVAAEIRDGVQTGWLARSGASVLTGVVLSDTAGRPWSRARCGRWELQKSSYSRSTIIRWRWFQIRVRSSSSRRQLPTHRSVIEFIRGA